MAEQTFERVWRWPAGFLGSVKRQRGKLSVGEGSFQFSGKKDTISSGDVKSVSVEKTSGSGKVVKVEYRTESGMSTDLFKKASMDPSGAWEEKVAAALYPLVDIGIEAQGILERVAKPAEGPLVREAAEESVARYFQVLGLSARPIRWIERESQEEACVAGFTEAWSKGLTFGMTPEEEVHAEGEAEKSLKPVKEVVERVAHAAEYVGQSKLRPLFETVAEGLRRARAQEGRGPRGRLGEWIEDIEDELGIGFLGPLWLQQEKRKAFRGMMVTKALAASKVMSAGVWAANRWAANEAGVDLPAVDRMVEILMPFVDAVDHGLWLYWITPDEVLAVTRELH